MNERIKSLAFQAGFVSESMYPILGTTQEQALNTFAEFIVRKCAALQSLRSTKRDGFDAYGDAEAIKKYFGIENE